MKSFITSGPGITENQKATHKVLPALIRSCKLIQVDDSATHMFGRPTCTHVRARIKRKHIHFFYQQFNII